MTQIRRLSQGEILFYRDKIYEWLAEGLTAYPPVTETPVDILEECFKGNHQLWGVFYDNILNGVFITMASKDILYMSFAAGKNILKTFRFLPKILANFAKENNIRYMQCHMLPSLAKRYGKDFHQLNVVQCTVDLASF